MKQHKEAKKKIVAQQFTKLHLAGQKGPKETVPLHGKNRLKRWCTGRNRDLWYRRNEPGQRGVNQFAGQ